MRILGTLLVLCMVCLLPECLLAQPIRRSPTQFTLTLGGFAMTRGSFFVPSTRLQMVSQRTAKKLL